MRRSPPRGTKDGFGRDLPPRGREITGHLFPSATHEPSPRRTEDMKRSIERVNSPRPSADQPKPSSSPAMPRIDIK